MPRRKKQKKQRPTSSSPPDVNSQPLDSPPEPSDLDAKLVESHANENIPVAPVVKPFSRASGSYRYCDTLDDHSIRVLALEPGGRSDPLRATLRSRNLECLDEIVALSYVWGDATKTRPLDLGSGCLNITVNLDKALRAVRAPDTTICLWADAVCVNQCDAQERGHQIKHMAAIYSRAKSVMVWLGPDPDQVGVRAFTFAEKLAHDPAFAEDTVKNWWASRVDIDCLREVSSRSWFHRMWTMQEIGLATSAIFLCGTSRIAWNDLFLAYDLFHKRLSFNNLSCLQFKPGNVVFLHTWTSPGKEHSFLDLLEISQSRGAGDPRDRVFALLSHPCAQVSVQGSPDRKFLIEPDYSESLGHVYTDVAESLVKEKRCLDVLSHVRGDERTAGLPSWAPNWQSPRKSHCLLDSPRGQSVCPPAHSAWWYDPDRILFTASRRSTYGAGTKKGIAYDRNMRVEAIKIGHATWISQPTATMEALALGPNCQIKQAWAFLQRTLWWRLGYKLLHSFRDALTCGLLHPMCRLEEEHKLHMDEFSAYWHHVWAGEVERNLVSKTAQATISPKQFASTAWYACKDRVIFCTDRGQVGVGPSWMKIDDCVALIPGGRVPYVLRNSGSAESVLIGECYVSGCMKGELLRNRATPWTEWVTLT